MTREEYKQELLSDPMRLIQKKPFYRGVDDSRSAIPDRSMCDVNEMVSASLPKFRYKIVTQDQFIKEFEPDSHKVLFDQNVPSITMKIDDRYVEIEYKKMAIPIQKMLVNKHVLHLCGNPMDFTLMDTDPTETQRNNFVKFKQYWKLRNQDGMRTKMVTTQKSLGDAGLLYYMDYKGRIKSRIISYKDGYVICPHNDQNGDRLLDSIYYRTEDSEYIDSYDDTYMYRYKLDNNEDSNNFGNWIMLPPVKHGFSESPLVTKRGDVSWNNVQSVIEVYEVMYNIFMVIQKRHGWGILYIKGKFSDEGKKIAGAIILNDRTIDGTGSAEFKTPPSPQGYIDTMTALRETIQEGAGATFLLPKDVKMSGDISGIAIMLTQSLDIENALQGVIDWQNVADKMTRLFKEGLAKELVNSGENPKAITEFENLNINAKFVVWKPRNDTEFNQMLVTLKGGGLISTETGVELNTVSKPDELSRVNTEKEKALEEQLLVIQTNNNNNNNSDGNSEGNNGREGE